MEKRAIGRKSLEPCHATVTRALTGVTFQRTKARLSQGT